MNKILTIFSILILSACATVFSGTTQTINVKVQDTNKNDIPNAVCTISDSEGISYSVVGSPSQVIVNKGKGALEFNFHQKGYRQLNTAAGESFDKVTLINVLFWPGFIVDAVSGSMKNYPSHFVVTMEHVKH